MITLDNELAQKLDAYDAGTFSKQFKRCLQDAGIKNYDFKYNTKSSYSNALKDSNVINVTGSTFQDIQDAIDRANDGDILYLKSYKFQGNGTAISINKPLTIIGSFEANNKSHY